MHQTFFTVLTTAFSIACASDDLVSSSYSQSEGDGATLVGEFSVLPSPRDEVVSSAGAESLSAHSGITQTETGQGGLDGDAADEDGMDPDDLYDKTSKNDGVIVPDKDPYQWWTAINYYRDLNFMSSFNPS